MLRVFNRQAGGIADIARTQFIDNIEDGMLALDAQDCIVDINAIAQRLLAPAVKDLIGKPADKVLPRWQDLANGQGDMLALTDQTLVQGHEPKRRYMEIRVMPVKDARGKHIGRLFILHDITETQQQLAETHTLIEKLREDSIHDELTGLYNRRYLTGLLTREISQAKRESNLLSVVIVDVDQLRAINEASSQYAGDLVLRQLADLLRRDIRGSDTACRYGGDEFIAVLPSTPPEGALVVGERWRAFMKKAVFDYEGARLHVTISLGIATYPNNADNSDALLAAADLALAAAKINGRDRTMASQTAAVNT